MSQNQAACEESQLRRVEYGISISSYPGSLANLNSLTGSPVKLLVGLEGLCIYAHPAVLSPNSDFFKAALKKQWMEGQTSIIKLPDDGYDVVDAYLQFLYCDSIVLKADWLFGYRFLDYTYLGQLYVFGEKVMDSCFQNRVMDGILAETWPNGSSISGVRMVNMIYGGTPEGSPARKLMVHMWHDHATSSWMKSAHSGSGDLPHDFLRDIAGVLLDARNRNRINISRKLVGESEEYYKQV